MTIVRLVVVRTGGFAGLTRTAQVDDPESARRLSAAVLDSAGSAADGRARDAFVYEFTVVSASSSRTVDLGESALPQEVRAAVRSLFT